MNEPTHKDGAAVAVIVVPQFARNSDPNWNAFAVVILNANLTWRSASYYEFRDEAIKAAKKQRQQLRKMGFRVCTGLKEKTTKTKPSVADTSAMPPVSA